MRGKEGLAEDPMHDVKEGVQHPCLLLTGKRLMTHKYRGSIVVLSISKGVEPNEEQKEMTSGFQ